MRSSILLVLGLGLAVFTGCGGGSAPPPDCTGQTCACAPDEACSFDLETCGNSCSLDCGDGAECSGTCGESCSIDCGAGATCEVNVGASGSVSCAAGSTCHVTCTGSCSVSCAGDATCDVTCPGDDAPTPFEGSGGCG